MVAATRLSHQATQMRKRNHMKERQHFLHWHWQQEQQPPPFDFFFFSFDFSLDILWGKQFYGYESQTVYMHAMVYSLCYCKTYNRFVQLTIGLFCQQVTVLYKLSKISLNLSPAHC